MQGVGGTQDWLPFSQCDILEARAFAGYPCMRVEKARLALSRKMNQTLTWAPPLGGGMVGKPEHLLADFHEYTKKAHRERLFYEEPALCHFL